MEPWGTINSNEDLNSKLRRSGRACDGGGASSAAATRAEVPLGLRVQGEDWEGRMWGRRGSSYEIGEVPCFSYLRGSIGFPAVFRQAICATHLSTIAAGCRGQPGLRDVGDSG